MICLQNIISSLIWPRSNIGTGALGDKSYIAVWICTKNFSPFLPPGRQHVYKLVLLLQC